MAMSVQDALSRLVGLFGQQASWDPTKLYGNLMVSPSGNVIIGSTTDDGNKFQINGTTRLGGSGLIFPDASTMYSAAMGRNRAINGACIFSTIAGPVTAGTANTYGGVDRFVCLNSAALGAFTQSQGTLTYNGITKYAVTHTVTTAVSSFSSSAYWSGISQIFEGLSVYDLVGEPISISFIFNTNVTGTYSVEIRDSGGAHAYTTTFTATALTPRYVTVSIPAYLSLAIAASTGVGLYLNIGAIGGTGLQAAALNAWEASGTVTASTSTNWGAAVGNYIQVTDLQLEAGPVSTPTERRMPGHEIALIQRFVEQLSSQYGVGGTNGSTLAYIPVKFQPKRVGTTTITSTAASTFYLFSSAMGNATPSAIAWSSASTTTALATATLSGATGGQACLLENQSGSYVNVLAEF